MKKIITLAFTLILFCLPTTEKAEASSTWLLNNKPLTLTPNVNDPRWTWQNVGTTLIMTDQSGTTAESLYRPLTNMAYDNGAYYQFTTPTYLTRFNVTGGTTANYFTVRFYDSEKNLLFNHQITSNIKSYTYTFEPIQNVSYVLIYNHNTASNSSVEEFNVLGAEMLQEVTNHSASETTQNTTKLSWTNPTSTDLNGIKIYKDNVLIATLAKTETSYNVSGLVANKEYVFTIKPYDTDGITTPGKSVTVKTLAPDEVGNLSASETTQNTTKLSWTNPTSTSFDGVKIYKGETLLTTLPKTATSYSVTGLTPGEESTFTIKALETDGSMTPGKSIVVKTIAPKIIKKVTNTNVVTKWNKVKLSWTIPTDQEGITHINIYRDEVKKEEPGFFESLFSSLEFKVYAEEEPTRTKIGQTDQAEFEDTTVKPDTEYEYAITVVTADGESDLVVLTTKTGSEPKPIIEGATLKQEASGDITVSWTNPTSGKIKILIAGKEFKTVDASLLKYTIPKIEMSYNLFGGADIKLVPIGIFGTEGDAIDLSKEGTNLSTPFTVEDLLKSGSGLLFVVAPLLLMSLAFLLVPKFRHIIIDAFQSKEQREAREARETTQRATREPREARETTQRATREPRERETTQRTPREQREPREARKGVN